MGLRCANVFFGKVRIIAQDVLYGIARGKATQDVLNRDAGPRNDGLAHHDLRITLNAWMLHRSTLLLQLYCYEA